MRYWLNHIHGAAALLDLRGEEQLNTDLGRKLFTQTRTQIISACYQTRSPIPSVVIQLSQKIRNSSTDPVEGLVLICFDFVDIRARIPFHPPASQTECTTRATIGSYTSIAQALADWHDGIPAKYLPSTVSTDSASSELLSQTYDVYEDIWTAGIANNYRANSILVHEAMISQLYFLQHHYALDLTEALELDEQISRSRLVISSLIDKICASVPYLLQSQSAAAGVGLLWALYISAQIAPRSASLDDVARTWTIRCLDKIGTEMGVRQATTLAGFLRNKVEVTDLFKDE
ncbi:hypothetical protein MMC10_002975 [Thelotrema lepadinum]|nr:hypothetical protein [Thelotrema lepadinum]